MPALQGADSRDNAARFVPAAAVVELVDGVGAYLTNGVFLYRVVGFVAEEVDEMVELEDCYGLDVVRVRARDLHARRLRVVAPAAEASP